MTLLSRTRARIKALPPEKRDSLEAEQILVIARQLQARPQAALSKDLTRLIEAIEQDKATEQGDRVDDLADSVALKLLPGGA